MFSIKQKSNSGLHEISTRGPELSRHNPRSFRFYPPQLPETQEEPLEEDAVSQNDLEALISGVKPDSDASPHTQNLSEKAKVLGKWVCAQSSQAKSQNHNKHLTDKLEQLAKAYTHTGDKWRALSYSKAINALKSHPKSISSYEVGYREAFKHFTMSLNKVYDSNLLQDIAQCGRSMIVKLIINDSALQKYQRPTCAKMLETYSRLQTFLIGLRVVKSTV